MKNLLLLAHRIPYPPTKGDKVRTCHALRYLSRHYRVFLGTFIDDPRDWSHTKEVEALCERAYFARLDPRRAKLRSALGFITGEPLTLPYFRDRGLRRWIERTLEAHAIDRVLVFCSSMAQYVNGDLPPTARTAIDFIDIDSDKWRQYSARYRFPWRWVYRREADRLFAYEKALVQRFDASIFVSEQESRSFARMGGGPASSVTFVRNGVDAEYFSPEREYPNPYPREDRVLAFTGAMDYRANIDAVRWYADEIFPSVHVSDGRARFYIVGSNPTVEVRSLAKRSGIHVTGSVIDIRPYLAHAHAAVAPLRIARGIQNKVLEARAMARPVIGTPAAMEGIHVPDGALSYVAHTVNEQVDLAVGLLEGKSRINRVGRDWVRSHHGWDGNLRRLHDILEGIEPDAGEKPPHPDVVVGAMQGAPHTGVIR